MGLFYNNDVAGSGVSKDRRNKRPFFRFFEIFGNKFWVFFQINFFYFLFCIPIVTIGPATAAMTALMRNIYLERPQFIFHDFWQQFKKNFKQSFFVGIADAAVIAIAAYNYWSYIKNGADGGLDAYWLLYSLSMACVVVFLFMNFYIYPQIVALNLKMGSIIKNSVILAFVNIKGNLISLAVIAVYIVLVMFFPFYVLAFTPVVPFAWIAFTVVFNCYPAIQRFIIDPYYDSIGERNPEYPEEDDDEALFVDRGGSEAPINLKKEKRGKVIK